MKRIAIDLNDVLRDFTTQFKTCYKKGIDNLFDMDDENLVFDFYECFPFKDKQAYYMFRYVEFAFELYGRSEPVDKMLPYKFNDWTQKILKSLDEENIPEVIIVCPFETGKAIQATHFFLSKIGSQVREVYFPVDSSTIWDKCDILITANPDLIESVPEGKYVFKVEKPYNKDVETKYSFKSLNDIIDDKEESIIKILCDE